MAVELNWPEGVPYNPLEDGYSIPQLYDQQLESQMDAGTTRARPKYTVNYRRQNLSLLMSATEVEAFEDWLVNDCRRGTARFNMAVWRYSAFVMKICKIIEGPSIVPYGVIGEERSYKVTFAIVSEES